MFSALIYHYRVLKLLLPNSSSDRRRAAIVPYNAAYGQRHHLPRLFVPQHGYPPYELYHLYSSRYYLTARLLHATAPARGQLRAEVFICVHVAAYARRWRLLGPLPDLRYPPVVGQPPLAQSPFILSPSALQHTSPPTPYVRRLTC